MPEDNDNKKTNTPDLGMSDAYFKVIEDKILGIKKLSSITLEDTVSVSKQKILDEYSNSMLGIGQADKMETFAKYGFDNDTLNWSLWLALYNDSWVFRRAIDKPSQDVAGYGVSLKGPTNKEEIYRRLSNLEFGLTQMVMWGTLFGGSAAIMLFNHVKLEYMYQSIGKAFNDGLINKDSTLKLYVTDRWYGLAPSTTERVTDLSSRHFGKPKYYNVMFGDGKSFRIHYSWVLRYEHRVAPNLIKKGMLQDWGYAEGAHILNELSRDDKIKASIHSLIDKSLIEVIKMAGMRGVFMGADSKNQEQLKKRLEMVNWGRNFNSLTFLDKDDEYQQNQFSGLAGLSDLLEKNMWLVASALEMQGILFGDLKGGFSTDNEALTRYNEVIQRRKNSYYREPLGQLIETLYKMYAIKDRVDFDFNSLITQKEEDKLSELSSFGTFLSSMIGDGVMTPQQVAKAIKKYSEKSGVELYITDQDIEKLKDTTESEMEGIDLDNPEGEEEEPPKKKFQLFKKTTPKDTFVGDTRHVYWIERKYNALYPALRVGWHDVRPEKQARTTTTLTPSLYIFDDKYPVGKNSNASIRSIRFSDHKSYFKCADEVIFKEVNQEAYEQAADRYIANHPKLMEKLYGH